MLFFLEEIRETIEELRKFCKRVLWFLFDGKINLSNPQSDKLTLIWVGRYFQPPFKQDSGCMVCDSSLKAIFCFTKSENRTKIFQTQLTYYCFG